jgi:hypothetical protein
MYVEVVICFQTLDLRSLITTVQFKIDNNLLKRLFVVICFQTLDLRSLITTNYGEKVVICFKMDLLISVVICFQTLDLRSLITTFQT